MPTYGYECQGCHAQLEVMQSIKDAPLTTCESCGGTLRKRVYPVGIAFKGSGFYVNDYAPKAGGSAPAPAAEAKTDTAAPASDAKTPEVKPAETPKTPEVKTEAPKVEAKVAPNS